MEIEFIFVSLILVYIFASWNSAGKDATKFIIDTVSDTYNNYAPYSYKQVRQKIKALNQDFTPRQYLIQVIMICGMSGVIAYLYFYNLVIAGIYAFVSFLFVTEIMNLPLSSLFLI